MEVALSNDGKSDCSVQRDKAQGQIELRATSAEVKVKQSFTFCPLFSKLKGTCQLRNRHQIETHLGIVPVLSSVKDMSYCGKEGLFKETLGLYGTVSKYYHPCLTPPRDRSKVTGCGT